eukprot:m.11925 g.11925  ORF g.11925 m.11925 type:complete len:868 (-) comp4146_c0_seq1:213-2816(-)
MATDQGPDLELNPFLRRSFRRAQSRRNKCDIEALVVAPPPIPEENWEADLLAGLEALEAAQRDLQAFAAPPEFGDAASTPDAPADAWWDDGSGDSGDSGDDGNDHDLSGSSDALAAPPGFGDDLDSSFGAPPGFGDGVGDDEEVPDPEAEAVIALLLAMPDDDWEGSEPPSPAVALPFDPVLPPSEFATGDSSAFVLPPPMSSFGESVASGAVADGAIPETICEEGSEAQPQSQPQQPATPQRRMTRQKTLRESVKRGIVSQRDALEASWWVDRQLRTIIKAVRLYGTKDQDTGTHSLPQHQLAQHTRGILEPLAGTLDVAEERGVIKRLVAADGSVVVNLLQTTLNDSSEDTYTFRQIRKCSVRSKKKPQSSVSMYKRPQESSTDSDQGDVAPPARRRLSEVARAANLTEGQILATAHWIDDQLRRLVREVRVLGGRTPSGATQVLFGTLRQHSKATLQPLGPTLLTAKKHGVVSFDPLHLDDTSAKDDSHHIVLLNTEIPDSDIHTYSHANVESMSTHRRVKEGKLFGSRCSKCGEVVFEAELLVANDFPYHRRCFSCSVCQCKLRLDTFHMSTHGEEAAASTSSGTGTGTGTTGGTLLCKAHYDQALASAGGAPDHLVEEVSKLQVDHDRSQQRFSASLVARDIGEQQMRAKIRAEELMAAEGRGPRQRLSSMTKTSAREHRAMTHKHDPKATVVRSVVDRVTAGEQGDRGSGGGLSRTLRMSVKQGKINRKEALSAAWWVDTQIRTLITVVKQFGAVGPSGKHEVAFGKLHQFASFMFTPLSGTLMTAKKRGVVTFEQDTLFVERDADVLVTLLRDTIEDANEDTYTVKQIRQCSIRRSKKRTAGQRGRLSSRLSSRSNPLKS